MLLASLLVTVGPWDPDKGAAIVGYFHRGDSFPSTFADAAALDREIASRGLEPLANWDATEEPGEYMLARIEDGEGNPDESGRHIVDYNLRLRVCEPRPYARPS